MTIEKNWLHLFEEPHYGVWTSHDEECVASATGNALRLWDTTSGSAVGLCQGHQDSIITADFSDDGRFLCSGSLDCTVRVWRTPWKPKDPTLTPQDCSIQVEEEDDNDEEREEAESLAFSDSHLPPLPEIRTPCPSPVSALC